MSTPNPTATLIALVCGDPRILQADAGTLITGLRYFAERDAALGRTIVVVDGGQWYQLLKDALVSIPRADIVTMDECHHPGRMVNRALRAVQTDAFSVVAIGAEISTWYANRDAMLNAMLHVTCDQQAMLVAGYRGAAEGRTAANESYLVHQDDQFSSDYPHAWLQMLDLVPMANCLVRTTHARALGGMTEAAALQRLWWWEFTQRSSRVSRIHSLPLQPTRAQSWHHFPLRKICRLRWIKICVR